MLPSEVAKTSRAKETPLVPGWWFTEFLRKNQWRSRHGAERGVRAVTIGHQAPARPPWPGGGGRPGPAVKKVAAEVARL
jgi:hypothetical protein